jgi:tetratricopeptide (TPR) repeat protein
MRYPLLVFLLIVSLLACTGNNETEAGLLTESPYAPLTDSIRQFPRNAALYYRRGALLFANNEPELALQDLRQSYALYPSERTAVDLTALLRQKGIDSALLFLEGATRQLPNSLPLQIGLARGYQAKGEREKAKAITDRLLEQYPDQPAVALLLRDLAGDEGEEAGRLKELEKAHALVPSDPALALDLAYAYAEAGNSRALRLADSLLKTGIAEPEKAHFCRAVYLREAGKPTDALRALEAAIVSNYRFLDAYAEKGDLLLSLRRYEEAFATFNKARAIAPEDAYLRLQGGRALQALGRNKEAREQYEEALRLSKSEEDRQAAREALGTLR